ncbi:RidA family protein [Streptacidiphilus sp. 4-A2]|nr:RidA family protein [Streptacidiphilus sp. 4-A2]
MVLPGQEGTGVRACGRVQHDCVSHGIAYCATVIAYPAARYFIRTSDHPYKRSSVQAIIRTSGHPHRRSSYKQASYRRSDPRSRSWSPTLTPTTSKSVVRTELAPVPVASFSQGVAKGGLLQVAGQVGFVPETGLPVGPGLPSRSSRPCAMCSRCWRAGGAGWGDVLMMRVYLTDTAHFAELNAVYDAWFARALPEGGFPARTTVYVGLPAGLLVEIDALAVTG